MSRPSASGTYDPHGRKACSARCGVLGHADLRFVTHLPQIVSVLMPPKRRSEAQLAAALRGAKKSKETAAAWRAAQQEAQPTKDPWSTSQVRARNWRSSRPPCSRLCSCI